MRPFVTILILPLAALTAACHRAALPPAARAAAAAPPPAARGGEWPTEAEVRGYLNGRTVSLPNVRDQGRAGKPYTLAADRIEALEVVSGGRPADRPWSSEVHFVYDTGEGRYAVVAHVEHRLAGGKRTFLGLSVQRASRE